MIKAECPSCGKLVTKDVSSDYLSYPRLNTPIHVPMHHVIERDDGSDDEHDFSIRIQLGLTAQVLP